MYTEDDIIDATHVTQLIGYPREGCAERGRRDLSQLDRDDAPSALHSELYAERSCRKTRERTGDDPERDERASQENEYDDGQATADVLGDVTGDGTA